MIAHKITILDGHQPPEMMVELKATAVINVEEVGNEDLSKKMLALLVKKLMPELSESNSVIKADIKTEIGYACDRALMAIHKQEGEFKYRDIAYDAEYKTSISAAVGQVSKWIKRGAIEKVYTGSVSQRGNSSRFRKTDKWDHLTEVARSESTAKPTPSK